MLLAAWYRFSCDPTAVQHNKRAEQLRSQTADLASRDAVTASLMGRAKDLEANTKAKAAAVSLAAVALDLDMAALHGRREVRVLVGDFSCLVAGKAAHKVPSCCTRWTRRVVPMPIVGIHTTRLALVRVRAPVVIRLSRCASKTWYAVRGRWKRRRRQCLPFRCRVLPSACVLPAAVLMCLLRAGPAAQVGAVAPGFCHRHQPCACQQAGSAATHPLDAGEWTTVVGPGLHAGTCGRGCSRCPAITRARAAGQAKPHAAVPAGSRAWRRLGT